MVIKRISLLALLALVWGSLGFADVIDKPVATVKLTRLEAITAKQFRQKVELLESRSRITLSLDDRKKLLDLLVSEILIKQAAAQENITVTQTELAQRMEQARKSGALSLNLNRDLSEAEFKSLIEQSGISWEEYSDQLQKSILTQKYVMQKKRAAFDSLGQPSEPEILDFYETNKAAFVVPDMVRFKHIFIDTRNLTDKAEKDKALNRAEEISRELKNGAAFDELVVKYSDDKSSRYKGGDFGYLRRDDQARKQLLGKDFFDAPFRMKVNESSGVLQSSIGYHIIRITEKIPFRLLGLEDQIPPQNTSTVRQEISAQLLLKKQADLYQQILQDLLAELKKKAEIKTFEDNLTW
jgi:parvulin-like peptidyl-prolyl isomerase